MKKIIIHIFTMVIVNSVVMNTIYADERMDNSKRNNGTLDQQAIDQCRSIIADHERLFCFDRMFETPLHMIENDIANNGDGNLVVNDKPAQWYEAWDKEKKRKSISEGFLFTQEKIRNRDAFFLTLPIEDHGLLLLGCVDIISRVELILDKPINRGVIDVKIKGRNNEMNTTWFMDDSGYILRKGRGLASIGVMKNILLEETIVLTFNDRSIVIPTADLREKIKPMRNLCRW